ncbi:hypothetical protein RI543_005093 [Arxiozyma heterogenica]|uniref:Uncharacterized protein n=1 Tax=Arxiozyma heterogenica TaxID=278026 RepID=A0AAN8A6B3_9SACH|nr:hypothetical protein RI543_005093 [Kazachstania heterogenica]
MLTSITFLLHFLLISIAFGKNICFTNIKLIDSYTKTQNCTDPAHFFLIETQLSISKSSYKDDVYFNVPSQFDSFPTLPLNISNNGQIVASIYEKENNVVGINFPNSFSQDTTINFNILTKLSNSTINSIKLGENITFSFTTSTKNIFNSKIYFLGKTSDSLTTNGGYSSNNNTAWFIADIPISLLRKAITFKSVKTGANEYSFNISATKLEAVTSVDSQGNPLKSVPFTAYTDKSTTNQIEILIDTMISGSAKFVRVYYFTTKLSKTPISYSAKLIQSNSLKKRDLTDSITGTIYGGNIGTETNNSVIVSSVSTTSVSMSTGYISTPLYSNNTYTSTPSYIASTSYTTSPTFDSDVNDIFMRLSSGLITTTSNNSSSIITSVPSSFSSSSSLSSSSFPSSNTTFFSNTTSLPSLVTSNNVVMTYKVYTTTNSAVVTEIGSYVAISTIEPTATSVSIISKANLSATSLTSIVNTFTSNSINIASTVTDISSVVSTTSTTKDSEIMTAKSYETTIATTGATIDSTNKQTTSVLSNSTFNASSNDLYTIIVNGVVISKTLSGDYSVETDLIPISTLSNGNVINVYQTEVSGSLVTKTMTAIKSVYTEFAAITRIYNLTTTISCSTEASFTVITKIQNGLESVATDFAAIATIRNKTIALSSTSTQVGKVVSTTTLLPINSVYSSLVQVAALSTENEHQSPTIINTALDVLTRSTSILKTTATIKPASSSSDANQSISISMAVPLIQSEIAQYSNFTHTTMSVVPYEAGSNKLVSSISCFFITLLALLF